MDTSRSDASSANEGKKWFRVTKTSQLYNVVVSINKKDTKVKIKPEAQGKIPMETSFWEPQLYKLIGGTRYKFIVQYEDQKWCELKLKSKNGKTFTLVSVKPSVKYPDEFGKGGGAGFEDADLGGFRSTKDGKFKAAAMFSRMGDLDAKKPKPKKLLEAPKRNKDGHLIYSAQGTPTIKTREYDPNANRVQVSGDKKDFLTAEMRQGLKRNYNHLAQSVGMDNMIPADRVLDVFEGVKGCKLSERQKLRITEFSRFDKDAFLDYPQICDILNRSFQEESQGHFHMTVKELQDLFNDHDEDYSGMIDKFEITKILNKVHMVTDHSEVGKMMSDMDKDGDGQMDFEEFMTLCQNMYKKRGGIVVANRAGPAVFNQTRTIIDELREKVERNHLMITHLKAQIQNFDEQLEIMDTIAAHSALQQELNKTRQEIAKLNKLMDQMTIQNRQWMRDIKNIHAREKREILERIQFIENQRNEAQEAFNFLKGAYQDDYTKAMVEVEETMAALQAVLRFARKSTDNVHIDSEQSETLRRLATERLRKYKEAEEGTVYSPNVYNSAQAIVEFLQGKTSALEEWLVARTQFTQSDREKYLKRVEEVKKKREEYEANKIELTKQLGMVEKKIQELEKKHGDFKKKNGEIRKKLDDPLQRQHDEKEANNLQNELTQLQEQIAQGHRDKLEWSKKLYPKEHQLHMERHKISLLQVELGELKVLLEDVTHHEDVEGSQY